MYLKGGSSAIFILKLNNIMRQYGNRKFVLYSYVARVTGSIPGRDMWHNFMLKWTIFAWARPGYEF